MKNTRLKGCGKAGIEQKQAHEGARGLRPAPHNTVDRCIVKISWIEISDQRHKGRLIAAHIKDSREKLDGTTWLTCGSPSISRRSALSHLLLAQPARCANRRAARKGLVWKCQRLSRRKTSTSYGLLSLVTFDEFQGCRHQLLYSYYRQR